MSERAEFAADAKLTLARVDSLTTLYDGQTPNGQGRRPVGSGDLLRAATVMLHATLEEFLRQLIRWYWPSRGSEEALDKVALLGLTPQGRPKAFLLGKLAAHRGKTVDAVLAESVDAYPADPRAATVGDPLWMFVDC